MGGEWKESTVGRVCERVTKGTTPTTVGGRFSASGVAFVKVETITDDGRLAKEKLAFIDEDTNRMLSRSILEENDVLFTIAGTIGRVARVPREILPANTNQAVAIVRPDRAVISPPFLYYALRDTSRISHARTRVVQSVQANFSLAELSAIELPVPPLLEQRAIAHILGTLDDKIDLNRRMNETLEAMARALYQSWFDGLPAVRVKVAELVRTGILEIGDGYRAKNSELGDTGLPFIRAGNLNRGFDTAGAERLSYESVNRAGSKICRVGDVAFTSKGTIGRFARVAENHGRFVYSPQVCYWRTLDPVRLHPATLYCWMQGDDLKAQIAAVAGQTDMAPYVSLQDQRDMLVPSFPLSQAAIGTTIEPLLARQSSNTAEAVTLAALRDTLLPKLLSGEIRVKDAEKVVDGALG